MSQAAAFFGRLRRPGHDVPFLGIYFVLFFVHFLHVFSSFFCEKTAFLAFLADWVQISYEICTQSVVFGLRQKPACSLCVREKPSVFRQSGSLRSPDCFCRRGDACKNALFLQFLKLAAFCKQRRPSTYVDGRARPLKRPSIDDRLKNCTIAAQLCSWRLNVIAAFRPIFEF